MQNIFLSQLNNYQKMIISAFSLLNLSIASILFHNNNML